MMSKKIGFLFGIIAGIVTVAYYLLWYIYNKADFFQLVVWWSGLIPMLIFMVLGVLRLRKQQEGSLTFPAGLQTAFLIFVLSSLCFYVFYFVLLKYVDSEMLQIQHATMQETLERFGQPRGDDLAPYADLYGENQALSISLGTVLSRFLQSLVGGFLLSLGIAFVLKNK